MKCPYRKQLKTYPDGLGRITECDFMECIKEECPFWGAIQYEWNNNKSLSRGQILEEDFTPCKEGCRKAQKEYA